MRYRTFLRAKIHRATVTGADLHYVGSITIDRALLKASGIQPYEMVHVANITNGSRLETYVLPGEEGQGEIKLNGAAAHSARIGDKVIIMAYTQVAEPLPASWTPTVLVIDQHNRVERIERVCETLTE